METAMLRQLLQSGSPASLTYGFAGFLFLNALSCVMNVLTDRFSALSEVFIDSVFDLSAAVLFPIVTLVYCFYNFDLDRECISRTWKNSHLEVLNIWRVRLQTSPKLPCFA
ncbi:hypothetical protein GN244_ATG12888 [Phytophthora infestans]|uniref:Transmembrane protein n=1 Tax=Phytophthora infestans TaxID=4787 RepID=A0A833SYB8_PHYIN|nr:hypothetical protein GN244_ATG12888 [Phytophthora infestans]